MAVVRVDLVLRIGIAPFIIRNNLGDQMNPDVPVLEAFQYLGKKLEEVMLALPEHTIPENDMELAFGVLLCCRSRAWATTSRNRRTPRWTGFAMVHQPAVDL